MKRTIEIANIPIEINTSLDCLFENFSDYLTDKAPLFAVETNERDIEYERLKCRETCEYEGTQYTEYTPEEFENTAVYRKIAMKLPQYDALVFHGSAVAVDKKAYLFTAKSGAGKTTHTNLWLNNIKGSFIINGDKPVLRVMQDKVLVCGTPWMGKEALGCNSCVELAGICFLSRGSENIITPVDFSQVYTKFIGQTFRPPESVMLLKTLKLIEKIGQSVPLYEMNCNTENEAAFTAYRGMSL